MPQLPQTGEIKKLNLPSTGDLPDADKAWVELKTGRILGGDMANLDDIDHNLGVAFSVLSGRIVDWNFQEGDGSKTPITLENIQRMEVDDISYLFEQLNLNPGQSLTDDQKKSSSTISELV